ncbi:Flp family type IVb pilin [Parvibaculum sp.]|jgi:pilus assembly protein Flp/PilA|uniref:Flp family type IVb pilin n=1 Tax=Parvibaculum sp. TaxID=2024848 RepID=UPI000C5B4F6E|nr:Flp family type IVb pilin [Parvibaculum sp.]HAC59537.1 Flp family type IVb pilin [Rhodobiaceae bacterium]MAU61606.1 Flp family type IVb pilin [Parvibaculum sp.]MAU62514.1 Flp family type IVb pilin [Parvibaculum sp.]MBO6666545.1 Flp family type IVb pilin [Parvibaculum sp.]MBO6690860.1 Flp family type IVb pilin [Parvibaculum sp.]|tara:strand:- start:171 stop:335 length:165 start_codon:yes stop_codon:yes gene_type:complete
MGQFLKTFAKNESGATAIEYALIAAGIAVVIIGAVASVGDAIIAKFEEIAGELA